MGLIDTMIEVAIASSNYKHYENLGYKIPRHLNKRGKTKISIGEKILVHSKDLIGQGYNVTVECDNCKKIFLLNFMNYKRHENTYCVHCYGSLFRKGENNPNYKKELTYEDRINDKNRNRNIIGYKDFIKSVLARDNYTCICCKQRHKNLNVHHLDSYDWCKDKRIEIENGITLCKTCHTNFHANYGLGENTKSQFEEWIGYALTDLKYNNKLTTGRKIYCYETDTLYDNAKIASEKLDISYRCVYDLCNHKIKNGRKGYHLFWYNEYVHMARNEMDLFIKNKCKSNIKFHPVVCIEYGIVYESINCASRYTHIGNTSISNNCKGRIKYVKDKDNDKTLHFMYYEDYLLKNNLTDKEIQEKELLIFMN